MLDKVVLQYTKDGVVEKNLATGESRLVAESDYAKEGKFKLPVREKQYHSLYEQPACRGLPKKHRKVLKVLTEHQKHSLQDSLSDEISCFTSNQNFQPCISQKKPETGGTKRIESKLWNLPSGRPEANRPTITGYSGRGSPKGGMDVVPLLAVGDKEKRQSSGANHGEGYIGFSEITGRVEFVPSGTENSVNGIFTGIKALPDIDRPQKKPSILRRGRKNGHHFLREVFRKYNLERNQFEGGEENLGLQTVKAAFRSGDRMRFGVHNLKKFRQFILRHPALIKFLLAVAAIFGGILLLCMLIYGLSGGFFGSAVEHPELTAYVQQLDENFINKINSIKSSYEQKGYVVTVEGDENIATDPGSLAVLVTKEWAAIDLTPENKAKLAQYHAILNSYTLSFSDETADGDKAVRHLTILIHVYTAEEKIGAFGFTPAEQSSILEIFGLLQQLTDETGFSSNGSGNVSGSVLAYRALVSHYCEQYGISGYANLVLAIMQQESGGSGNDPMQCSECSYNTRYPHSANSITDPAYSIQCGVEYFASCLRAAGCKSPSDQAGVNLALQGYNFGGGYISWAKAHGGYSAESAARFSRMKAAEMGLSGYGDPQYVSHVMKYYNAMQSGNFIWPLPGHTYISSGYGSRVDPITGKAGAFHTGLDIPAPTGTPVLASAGGKVILARWYGGFGNCVIIQHSNGIQTLYGHNSALLVQQGDTVTQGQAIAKVGQTGRATGPHCHFEFRINGQHVDPTPYLKGVSKK